MRSEALAMLSGAVSPAGPGLSVWRRDSGGPRIPGPEGPGMEGRPPDSPRVQAWPAPLPVVSGPVRAVVLQASRSCPGLVLAGYGRGRARRDSGRASFDASGCPLGLCSGPSVYLYI